MIKPNNYDQVQEYGAFTPLELGGHLCKIMSVEVTKSSTGKEMLIISADTDNNDRQPGYYAEQWRSDTRAGKKWGCRVWQLVLDNDGNTNKGLKTFITSVEKSNPGFTVQWVEDNNKFAEQFKNKRVGGVFGREQYLSSQNELKFATKLVNFRSIDAVLTAEIPADKLLAEQPQVATTPASNNSLAGFEEVIADGNLPF